jgi:hypothetical protein
LLVVVVVEHVMQAVMVVVLTEALAAEPVEC